MKEDLASATALRVAIHRAAHQIMDDPRVFDDPLALLILNVKDEPHSHSKWPDETPIARGTRAFVAARSRFAEDELHVAIKRGVRQYVVLGAGLDTFAYRNPYPEGVLHVFEVDHPATQIWKLARVRDAAIAIPQTLTFSPVDFENQTLQEGLLDTGFDMTASTFFSWLGVTMYLSDTSIMETFGFVASMPPGSAIVFDYTLSPSMLGPKERWAFDIMADRVAKAGEPFLTTFDPSVLKSTLIGMGFGHAEDLDLAGINARFFQGRTDGLKVGGFSHLMNARV